MATAACIGECMLELSGNDFKSMTFSYGGDTLNTAVYLARLNIETQYVTALGDDPYSAWMIGAWREEGVGTDYVHCAPGRLPGLYAIRTDDRGEREFFYWREQAPARDLFSAVNWRDLASELTRCRYVYLSGITLSLYDAAQIADLCRMLDTLRESGSLIVFDSNFRGRGWQNPGAAATAFDMVLSRTDIALPTFDDDALVYGDANASACAGRLHDAGVAEVVVKLNAEGCLVSTGDGQVTVETIAVDKPVDTTGAGDSFNASYLAARHTGATPIDAARKAHILAGSVIMHRGAIIPRDAMPGDG